ncbi:MAG: hypothetical protein KME02_04385 [Aphanothece saxicola GSE-SYN-MK-01-06B]|jgi:hypothetical protein|nr:hypothetical protein [Aphanothece saxicola GSE-SYN-MK-01-06B]
MTEVVIRHLEQDDDQPIISVVDEWWGGRPIAFHRRIGFSLLDSDDKVDGLPVAMGYDGEGEDRVIFIKDLDTLDTVR